jgi:Tfp pilus assembly protein PilF
MGTAKSVVEQVKETRDKQFAELRMTIFKFKQRKEYLEAKIALAISYLERGDENTALDVLKREEK